MGVGLGVGACINVRSIGRLTIIPKVCQRDYALPCGRQGVCRSMCRLLNIGWQYPARPTCVATFPAMRWLVSGVYQGTRPMDVMWLTLGHWMVSQSSAT